MNEENMAAIPYVEETQINEEHKSWQPSILGGGLAEEFARFAPPKIMAAMQGFKKMNNNSRRS